MIEEAAGTRMYECKKISAQKTIEKKEAKLKEIQTVRQALYNPNVSTPPFCAVKEISLLRSGDGEIQCALKDLFGFSNALMFIQIKSFRAMPKSCDFVHPLFLFYCLYCKIFDF